MKTWIAMALTGLATTAWAASPAAPDSLAGSFERMLAHPATPTAPVDLAVLARLGVDPLHAAVKQVLWQMEPDSHHLGTQLASSSPTPR